ncbi:uncharacterized protein V1510DRAFT_424060, partial [Dipodascopsis tothii]|uniref:uncharacterized protein n=1 Tax=Dipodascopsis tothii TaxID=44089 RepID=UPI0034CD7A1D
MAPRSDSRGSSKFVYANGQEEVLVPRAPERYAAASAASASPAASRSSRSSLGDEIEPSSGSGSEYAGTDDESGSGSDADAPGFPDTGNARFNRKILDLEISNTSLLAINRTLEREMRAQNRELRALRKAPDPREKYFISIPAAGAAGT